MLRAPAGRREPRAVGWHVSCTVWVRSRARPHPSPTDALIEHDAAAHRVVDRLAEGDAYLSYTSANGALDLQHTVVPEAARGRGVGESLVEAAIAYAREQGARVIPSCPFVQSWLDEHPDAQDLVQR